MIITIIDYGMGNLRSVQKKFQRVGANVVISNNPSEIMKAQKLVLPGVGHFSHGVKNLKKLNIWNILNKMVLNHQTPILGICLGMQLMAKHSEEGNIEGFGWFDADVVKFKIKDKLKYKVPQVGWNSVIVKKESSLFKGISKDAMFYFVHSYHIRCNNQSDILASSDYEYRFTSAIEKDNIYGSQFHPEKSHDLGEQIFRNFVNI